MKAKNLVILVVVAAVLVGLAYLSSSRRAQRTESAASAIGKKVVPALQDTAALNSIEKIVFESPAGAVTVARVNDQWVSPAMYGYPVKFERVHEFVRQLAELKIGQTVPGGERILADLKLLTPQAGGTNAAVAGAGTLARLEDAQGRAVASIVFGKEHMRMPPEGQGMGMPGGGGWPDGRYVAVDGKPCLVAETFSSLPTGAKDWLDTDIVNVSSFDLARVGVADGKGNGVMLTKADGSNDLTIQSLAPNEEMITSKVNSLAGTLSYLTFTDIVDPAVTNAQLGFDNPIVMTARDKNHKVYTLKVGAASTNATERYVRLTVVYAPPSEETAPASTNQPALSPEEQKAADDAKAKARLEREKTAADIKRLNDRVSKWTYVVSAYKVEGVAADRSSYVKVKEPPKTEAPATNAAPASAAAPVAVETPAAATVPPTPLVPPAPPTATNQPTTAPAP